MADRRYIEGLSQIECTDPVRLTAKFLEISNYLNELLTVIRDLETYADNAAAVTAGLGTGDWYYDSTVGATRIVT